MDDFDSLDIELRESDDIGARIAILTTLVVWPEHENLPDREHWTRWLEQQGLLNVLTDTEERLLIGNLERELTNHDLEVCGRAFDAMLPLTWTIGLSDSCNLTLGGPDTKELFAGIPLPPDKIEPFLDGLVLRDEDVIAVQRERAEVWNWRLAAEISLRRVSILERGEIEEAIAEVVLECSTGLVIEEIDGVDFLIDEVHVRDLNPDQLDSVLVASEENLRALNWVCSLTDWEIIHLPD